MFGFFLYRDSWNKKKQNFGAFRVTLASRRVEKSSTTVDVNLGKIFSLIVVQVMQGFRMKILAKKQKTNNKYLSSGSIIGGRSFRKPLYFVLPRPQTALFCSSQTANRFRFLLKTETAWPYANTNITITDSFNNISYISYYMPGGALGYFLGGYVPPGTPEIDTPF